MDNPYQATVHSGYPVAAGQVSQRAVEALAGTKPWVRLCSVTGFLCTGFMALFGLMFTFGGATTGMQSRETAALAGTPVLFGLIYIGMAVVYFIPALKLWKYGSSIVRLISSGSAADLEEALDQQRGFWKFAGIMILMVISFIMLSIIAGMVVAITGMQP